MGCSATCSMSYQGWSLDYLPNRPPTHRWVAKKRDVLLHASSPEYLKQLVLNSSTCSQGA